MPSQKENRFLENPLLEKEIAFYDANLEEFLHRYPNRVLLIKGSELIGTFENADDAIKEGMRRYGTGPFLIRRPGEKTPTFTVPILSLGIPCRS